jgi:hypothetical protein
MNKSVVLVVILAMAVFLTGCGTMNTGTTTGGNSFVGGTEGLRTTFLPGSPPERTTDGGSSGFSIVLKAENAGENTVLANDGYVQIWGLDANTYGTVYTDFRKYFYQQEGFGTEIRGTSMNFDGSTLNGGVATIDFGDLRYMPSIQGDIQQKVWANVCYRYANKATTQLCIKNDAEQAFSGTQICVAEGEKSPQNSGGPVHVTSLKESYAGNGRIGVTLTIKHVGTGDNIFKDDQLNCNDVESNLDRGKVRVTFRDVQVAGRNVPVVCQGLGDGYVRLYKDSSGSEMTTIYCTIDTSGSNNVVEVPLDVTLSYVYLQHVEKNLIIRHVE